MVASTSSGSRDGAASEKSQGGCGHLQAVKKGPWTTAEDAILVDYVRNHGEGNWNAVQRNSGLLRCGKSCRLRWANHLRPNLKKGAFSPDEESLIIELHAKHGNKWARMASQLPGRTDNEIKNYWNTRVKRLQRAGLPIYPDQCSNSQQCDRQRFQQRHPPTSSLPSFSSLSPQLPSLSLFTPFNLPTTASYNFPLQPAASSSFTHIGSPNLPMTSSLLQISSPPPCLFGPSFVFQSNRVQFKSGEFGGVSPPTMGGAFDPVAHLVPAKSPETELPSIQSLVLAAANVDSSGSSGGDNCMMDDLQLRGGRDEEYCVSPKAANSGLLDALLDESKALAAHAGNLKKQISEDAAGGGYDSSSAHSSIHGFKAREDLLEEMNQIDDDLSSLLNNFPLTVPVPDWYDLTSPYTTSPSNGQLSNNMEDADFGTLLLNNQPDASTGTPVSTSMPKTNPDQLQVRSYCWKNMPGIC